MWSGEARLSNVRKVLPQEAKDIFVCFIADQVNFSGVGIQQPGYQSHGKNSGSGSGIKNAKGWF